MEELVGISWEELEVAVKKMSSGKSPGLDKGQHDLLECTGCTKSSHTFGRPESSLVIG